MFLTLRKKKKRAPMSICARKRGKRPATCFGRLDQKKKRVSTSTRGRIEGRKGRRCARRQGEEKEGPAVPATTAEDKKGRPTPDFIPSFRRQRGPEACGFRLPKKVNPVNHRVWRKREGKTVLTSNSSSTKKQGWQIPILPLTSLSLLSLIIGEEGISAEKGRAVPNHRRSPGKEPLSPPSRKSTVWKHQKGGGGGGRKRSSRSMAVSPLAKSSPANCTTFCEKREKREGQLFLATSVARRRKKTSAGRCRVAGKKGGRRDDMADGGTKKKERKGGVDARSRC